MSQQPFLSFEITISYVPCSDQMRTDFLLQNLKAMNSYDSCYAFVSAGLAKQNFLPSYQRGLSNYQASFDSSQPSSYRVQFLTPSPTGQMVPTKHSMAEQFCHYGKKLSSPPTASDLVEGPLRAISSDLGLIPFQNNYNFISTTTIFRI